MARITMTYELARAAATDAGNRNMRADGRTKWNQDDFLAASEEFHRLWKSNEPMLRKGATMIQYNMKRSFLTRSAALAFREGVFYVNDSRVEVVAIRVPRFKDFIVYVLDEDKKGRRYNVPESYQLDQLEVEGG